MSLFPLSASSSICFACNTLRHLESSNLGVASLKLMAVFSNIWKTVLGLPSDKQAPRCTYLYNRARRCINYPPCKNYKHDTVQDGECVSPRAMISLVIHTLRFLDFVNDSLALATVLTGLAQMDISYGASDDPLAIRCRSFDVAT